MDDLDAAAAREFGIVGEVVPAADLAARADEIARRVASGPTAAHGRFKRLVEDAHAAPLDDHMERERDAFLGKRPPAFTGA